MSHSSQKTVVGNQSSSSNTTPLNGAEELNIGKFNPIELDLSAFAHDQLFPLDIMNQPILEHNVFSELHGDGGEFTTADLSLECLEHLHYVITAEEFKSLFPDPQALGIAPDQSGSSSKGPNPKKRKFRTPDEDRPDWMAYDYESARKKIRLTGQEISRGTIKVQFYNNDDGNEEGKDDYDESNGLFFNSFEEVQKADTHLAWEPLEDDFVPTASEDRKFLIRELVAAIRNNVGCVENPTSSSFKIRWGEYATYFSDRKVEKLAWRLLTAMIKVHQEGWTEPIYDAIVSDGIANTLKLTFVERFHSVTSLLRISKRTCEDLFKGNQFWQVIGAAHILESRCRSNKKQNQHKQDQIRRGAAIEKQEKRKREER